MAYEELKKLYYTDPSSYEANYQARFGSPYAHHIAFSIGASPAFFVVTPELQDMMLAIQRADKDILRLCSSLPGAAIAQFSSRCLIDEIVLTNSIEGVHSTRREINDALSALKTQDKRKRFQGLVQKYVMLQQREYLSLSSCQDIRQIYDDLVLDEIRQDDPENVPDGSIFRKGPVSVYSSAQREIHQGLYPEEKIIEAMDLALSYLSDEREELLYRTAVFHYLLGYIHPFYDGNGRLNRFISSYMLSTELESVLSYRLSYTIKENIDRYYQAFRICNDPLNKGDLTPFLLMFIEIIRKSIVKLREALKEKLERLEHYANQIEFFPNAKDNLFFRLYYVLIQAELFSEHGISTLELLEHLDLSRVTLRARLSAISSNGFLKVQQIKKEKFYGMDLPALDAYIDRLSQSHNKEKQP